MLSRARVKHEPNVCVGANANAARLKFLKFSNFLCKRKKGLVFFSFEFSDLDVKMKHSTLRCEINQKQILAGDMKSHYVRWLLPWSYRTMAATVPVFGSAFRVLYLFYFSSLFYDYTTWFRKGIIVKNITKRHFDLILMFILHTNQDFLGAKIIIYFSFVVRRYTCLVTAQTAQQIVIHRWCYNCCKLATLIRKLKWT